MARPFRTNLRTSSAPQHPPFKVEVVNGRDILCHVGRVCDPVSSGSFGWYLQRSWDATQGKFTSKGLPSTRTGRVQLKYNDFEVVTGSATIHYKGTIGTANHGRATFSTATRQVGENGYVKWLRSDAPADNYIVLHNENTKWCISAVNEEDVIETDIVLAYIANNTTVRQVWKSDVYVGVPENHPFKCTIVDGKIRVSEGTVTNKIATALGGGDLTEESGLIPIPAGESRWLVQLKITSTDVLFPETVEVMVVPLSAAGQNSTTESYVTIAAGSTIQGYSYLTGQYIKTSLWGEKILFVEFANYYYYRV